MMGVVVYFTARETRKAVLSLPPVAMPLGGAMRMWYNLTTFEFQGVIDYGNTTGGYRDGF